MKQTDGELALSVAKKSMKNCDIYWNVCGGFTYDQYLCDDDTNHCECAA